MSKVMILSDTHNNHHLLRKVLENEVGDCEYVFHLGDNYEDLDAFPDLLNDKTVIKVPGIFHSGYLDGSIPATQNININGWTFFLVHNIDDLPEILPNQQIICYGHSHKIDFRLLDDHYYLNPGHLKDEMDKNRPASYAILDVSIDKIVVEFKGKDGTVTQKQVIDRYD